MAQSIRVRPAHEVVRALKAKRIRQVDIAAEVGVSDGYVSRVISRHARRSDLSERVWTAIEKAVNGAK